MDDKLNHQAYMDVSNCDPPKYPDDKEYMKCYDFWRPLQTFPDDDWECYTD